jgi:GDP-mannose 6-dehydrogenase
MSSRYAAPRNSERRIAVFGLGYVGCVTAACLAHLNHRVVGVDRDAFKVERIRNGQAPFIEHRLEELIRAGIDAGTLQATTEAAEALSGADVAMICVGTPSRRTGKQSLDQLERVCTEIARCIGDRETPLTLAVRSTVCPGTCEELVVPLLKTRARIVSHPEFLREGTAVRDFLHPGLLVVGGSDAEAVETIAHLYADLDIQPCRVGLRAAEMIKYACNAFHALKVTFANEIGSLCALQEIDGSEVMNTLCRDAALNISAAYLRPGFAFGGSCLPKDLRALVHRAGRLGLQTPLLDSVLPSNDAHLRRAIQAVLDLPASRLGVFGLTFKENTDDLRESPVVTLLEHLIGKGRKVRVFDPHVAVPGIYGSNERFLLSAIPHIGKLLDADVDHTLRWADHLVLAQRPAREHAEKIRNSGLPVLDLQRGDFAAALKEDAALRQTA